MIIYKRGKNDGMRMMDQNGELDTWKPRLLGENYGSKPPSMVSFMPASSPAKKIMDRRSLPT